MRPGIIGLESVAVLIFMMADILDDGGVELPLRAFFVFLFRANPGYPDYTTPLRLGRSGPFWIIAETQFYNITVQN